MSVLSFPGRLCTHEKRQLVKAKFFCLRKQPRIRDENLSHTIATGKNVFEFLTTF